MIRKYRRIIAYILMAALLLGLSGCATWDNFNRAFINPPSEDIETVKIAVLEPLTGEDAKAAEDEIAGIKLAFKLFPTVLGKDVELVFYDTKSNIEDLKEAAQTICSDEAGISIVLGSYGSAMSIAAGDIFKEHFMPAIAITCTNPLLTRTNSLYSRVCYIDLYEAAGAAEFVYKYLGTADVAILTQRNNDYSKAKGEEFSERISALSGKDYIPVTAYDQANTDLEAILKTFSLAGAKVIYLPENAETAKAVIAKAEELALEFDWVGPSDWDGAGLEGVYFTVDYAADEQQTDTAKKFNEAYAAEYGSGKTPSQEAALGFDAYLLALRGMEDAGSSMIGSLISFCIRQVKDLEGATGIIMINEIGDPVKSIMINKSSGGKQTTVYTVDPARIAGDLGSTDNNDPASTGKEQQ